MNFAANSTFLPRQPAHSGPPPSRLYPALYSQPDACATVRAAPRVGRPVAFHQSRRPACFPRARNDGAGE